MISLTNLRLHFGETSYRELTQHIIHELHPCSWFLNYFKYSQLFLCGVWRLLNPQFQLMTKLLGIKVSLTWYHSLTWYCVFCFIAVAEENVL